MTHGGPRKIKPQEIEMRSGGDDRPAKMECRSQAFQLFGVSPTLGFANIIVLLRGLSPFEGEVKQLLGRSDEKMAVHWGRRELDFLVISVGS
jgi:hypothetical protein